MSKLKSLDYGTLVAKMESNSKAIAALEAAGVLDHVAPLKAENTEIEAELAGRKGEQLTASLSPAIAATLTKELAGKEADLDARTVLTTEIIKNEDGSLTIKTTAGGAKKVRVASEGGVSAGNRGERKGAIAVTLEGVEIKDVSAKKVMEKLQEMKKISPDEGIGDSAVRVLRKAEKNGLIKSFTQFDLPKFDLPKEEKAETASTDATSEDTSAVLPVAEATEEKISKKK